MASAATPMRRCLTLRLWVALVPAALATSARPASNPALGTRTARPSPFIRPPPSRRADCRSAALAKDQFSICPESDPVRGSTGRHEKELGDLQRVERSAFDEVVTGEE